MIDTTRTSADSTTTASAREEPTDLELMFGRPRLLKGEDRRPYDFLRSEVQRMLAPTDLFGELRVQEVTDALWEANRFKRFAYRAHYRARGFAPDRVLEQPVH